jgi:hypothetical protein
MAQGKNCRTGRCPGNVDNRILVKKAFLSLSAWYFWILTFHSRSRESQEHESDSFKSIFKEGIVYLKGDGADSGKRLLLVKGRTHHLSAQEVDLGSDALNRYTCRAYALIIAQKCPRPSELHLSRFRKIHHPCKSMRHRHDSVQIEENTT